MPWRVQFTTLLVGVLEGVKVGSLGALVGCSLGDWDGNQDGLPLEGREEGGAVG